eukprot:CFRG1016T1
MVNNTEATARSTAKPENTSYDAVVCGSLSGLLSRMCIAPLDVIKIRLQLQVEPISGINRITRKATAANAGYYRGWIHAMRTVVLEEGATALFKGNLTADLLYLGFGAAQFGFYNEWRKQFTPVSNTMAFLGGGLAGSVATVVTYPLDLMRTRLAAQGEPKIYKSLTHAIGELYKIDGVRGFYRGLIPTIVQIFPYMSLQFCLYEGTIRPIKRLKLNRLENAEKDNMNVNLSTMEYLLAGSFSGAASKFIVLPMDVVRKRLQVQGFDDARQSFGRVVKYNGTIHCIGVIFKNEGIGGFYKGAVPATLKALIASAVTWMAFEQLSRLIREQRSRRQCSSDE